MKLDVRDVSHRVRMYCRVQSDIPRTLRCSCGRRDNLSTVAKQRPGVCNVAAVKTAGAAHRRLPMIEELRATGAGRLRYPPAGLRGTSAGFFVSWMFVCEMQTKKPGRIPEMAAGQMSGRRLPNTNK
jgi:hypothetical protein